MKKHNAATWLFGFLVLTVLWYVTATPPAPVYAQGADGSYTPSAPPESYQASLRTNLKIVADWIDQGDVDLVINTPTGTAARSDGYEIRRAAVARGVPCITTIAGGMAAARAIGAARFGEPPVLSFQELHRNGGHA